MKTWTQILNYTPPLERKHYNYCYREIYFLKTSQILQKYINFDSKTMTQTVSLKLMTNLDPNTLLFLFLSPKYQGKFKN